MLARSFLFKILNFPKSSRLVFITMLTFGTVGFVDALDSLNPKHKTSKKIISQVRDNFDGVPKNKRSMPVLQKMPVPREKFKRCKSFPF